MELDSVENRIFTTYDVYFLGEKHGYNHSELAELLLIKRIRNPSTKILLEGPYDRNFGLNKLFSLNDSITYSFDSFNPTKEHLLRYSYLNNVPIKLVDIVLFQNIYKKEVLEVLEKAAIDQRLKPHIEKFKEIAEFRFPNKRKNLKLYSHSVLAYENNKRIFNSVLREDSTRIEEFYLALKAAIQYQKESRPVWSNSRENLMYHLVTKSMEENHARLICINGAGHSFFGEGLKRVANKKGWTSVANKVKTDFPQKRICNILIWNRNEPLLAGYYTKEQNYILNSTNPAKIYFIKLDYPNSPFEKLKSNFNYIMVYGNEGISKY